MFLEMKVKKKTEVLILRRRHQRQIKILPLNLIPSQSLLMTKTQILFTEILLILNQTVKKQFLLVMT